MAYDTCAKRKLYSLIVLNRCRSILTTHFNVFSLNFSKKKTEQVTIELV